MRKLAGFLRNPVGSAYECSPISGLKDREIQAGQRDPREQGSGSPKANKCTRKAGSAPFPHPHSAPRQNREVQAQDN